ncbi:zinc knuckle CX2CX4HX4C containing protein [Tanacetum coccineum]
MPFECAIDAAVVGNINSQHSTHSIELQSLNATSPLGVVTPMSLTKVVLRWSRISGVIVQPLNITLSRLLKFNDGLWSSCGYERIIVFITNHRDSLDEALLRPGRMDVHLEMSYCTYGEFKVLASTYLQVKEEEKLEVFHVVKYLLEKVKVTLAEIANQMVPVREHECNESFNLTFVKLGSTMAGVDIDTLTMEQYLALSRENQASGMVKHEIGGNVNFEIKRSPKKAFIQRYCPPSKTAKQLEDIHKFTQEGYKSLYQAWEWYNDLLYKCPTHDINSHQKVGCQICEGPHLDKDCPLNEEVKQVEEVRYGEFGRTTPFNRNNGGKFHVGPPGYYTKTDNRPPYGERRQSLEELLAKH